MSDGLAIFSVFYCNQFITEVLYKLKNIITISRETGSGGHTIGKMLSERLGYDFFDSEIVMQVAKKMKLADKIVEESGEFMTDETYIDMISGFIPYNPFSRKKPVPYDQIQSTQEKLITQIAQKGNCVIVGRGADCILRDYPNAFHIFIHADMKCRVERVRRHDNITDNTQDERIALELEQKDHARAAFYRYYAKREWGMVSNYNLMLDTSLLSKSKCCDIIMNILKEDN